MEVQIPNAKGQVWGERGRVFIKGRELCKNGWTNRDAVWDVDLVGPRNYALDGVQVPHRKKHFWEEWHQDFSARRRVPFPVALTSEFPCVLSTSVPIGWPTKYSTATWNFPLKIPLRCGLLSNFFDHLLLLYWQILVESMLGDFQIFAGQNYTYGFNKKVGGSCLRNTSTTTDVRMAFCLQLTTPLLVMRPCNFAPCVLRGCKNLACPVFRLKM